MNGYQIIDLLWKIDFPISLILAIAIFLIVLKKKKNFYVPLIIGSLILIGLAFLIYIPVVQNNKFLHVCYYLITYATLFFLVYFTIDDVGIYGALFVFALVISIQHICYKLTLGTFILIDPILSLDAAIYFPVYLIFNIVGLFISYFFIARKLNPKLLSIQNRYALVSIVALVICDVFVNFFTYDLIFIDMPEITLISSLINLSGIITTLLAILFLYSSAISKSISQENALLKLISDKDRERYELAKITIDEINIKCHDLKHALQNNQLTEDESKEIEETLTNYKAIISTSNRGLNVVVYESQLKCISKGIDLSVLIDGDPLSFMKPHHVYSLFSNLLDNAIEAVEDFKEKENKRIFLNISTKKDNIIIKLTNYCDKNIVFNDGYPVSSKNDKNSHGYGIRSAEKIINQYDGNLSLSVLDNEFKIEILLPIRQDNLN